MVRLISFPYDHEASVRLAARREWWFVRTYGIGALTYAVEIDGRRVAGRWFTYDSIVQPAPNVICQMEWKLPIEIPAASSSTAPFHVLILDLARMRCRRLADRESVAGADCAWTIFHPEKGTRPFVLDEAGSRWEALEFVP